MDIWHYDIQEFIKVGLEHGADVRRKSFDIFPQISIPDLFMEYVLVDKEWYMVCPYEVRQVFGVDIINLISTDFKDFYENSLIPNIDKLTVKAKINAKELLKEVVKVQHETGLPYIFFKDTVAKYNQNTGTIYSTNLCVTGDTLLLTDKGHIPIEDLEGQKVTVWNGFEWSENVPVFKTSDSQEVWKVEFSNGKYIECTPYHKFVVRVEDKQNVITELQELNVGDKLVDYNIPRKFVKGCKFSSTVVSKYILELDKDVTITNIDKTPKLVPTYCCTEPLNHTVIFNGTISSQCTEYLSPTVPDELISVCNLAAINLANVRSNEIVKYAQLLAKCLDLLIDYTEVPINEGKNHNRLYRTIGIGIVGLADYLAKKNVNYHTGTNQIIDVFEKLAYGSLLGSVKQAKVKDVYPYYDGSSYRTMYLGKPHSWFYELDKHFENYTPAIKASDWGELFKDVAKYGVRNSELTCLMPNTSTALLQGCTASFLPVYAKLFNEKLGKGSIPITPKYLNNKFSYYTENISFDQSLIIEIVGKYIQPFISMGISMELLYNLSLDYINPKFMFDNIIKAWELDCKTIYYIRSKQDSVGCTSCAN